MRPPSLMAPYRLRLPLGAVDEVALRLDRPENQLLIYRPAPGLAQGAPRRAVLPERDRRPCHIRGSRFDDPVLSQHEDAREITRVVFKRELAAFPAHQPAQLVRPVADVEEMQAVTLQDTAARRAGNRPETA